MTALPSHRWFSATLAMMDCRSLAWVRCDATRSSSVSTAASVSGVLPTWSVIASPQ